MRTVFVNVRGKEKLREGLESALRERTALPWFAVPITRSIFYCMLPANEPCTIARFNPPSFGPIYPPSDLALSYMRSALLGFLPLSPLTSVSLPVCPRPPSFSSSSSSSSCPLFSHDGACLALPYARALDGRRSREAGNLSPDEIGDENSSSLRRTRARPWPGGGVLPLPHADAEAFEQGIRDTPLPSISVAR